MSELHDAQRRVEELKDRLRLAGILVNAQKHELDKAHSARANWKFAFFAVTLLLGLMTSLGCTHIVGSVGAIHVSDPTTQVEVDKNFVGGGATIEFENTDIHFWLGASNSNRETMPGIAVVIAHKIRKKQP